MKNIICVLLCLVSGLLAAQEVGKHTIQWGFVVGIETQSLGIETFGDITPDKTAIFSEGNNPGITLGITGKKPIWRGLALESGLSLAASHNTVYFWPSDKQTYRFRDIEWPVYLSYTNQKKGESRLRGKVLFGPRLGWNLAEGGDSRFKLYRERLGLDLGLGVEIRFSKFKILPEVIYSHGINNLHDFTGTEYDFLAGRAVRDKLAFRLLFEGI